MARLSWSRTKMRMPELDPAERVTNFEEVAIGYTAELAVLESLRCIRCPGAPCTKGCPVGVPIREFIGCLADGNFGGAYGWLKDANALPAICGRVCPQESQCEGRCTRGRKGEPVAIGRLERYVADWAYAHPYEAGAGLDARQDFIKEEAKRAQKAAQRAAAAAAEGAQVAAEDVGDEPQKDAVEPVVPVISPLADLSGKRVAMVGSGPASLTCAGELAKHGAECVVFEALHEVGGVLTYGIPEFRLPKELVAREVEAVKELGVTFETNAVIGKLFGVRELLDEKGFDAVFVGTGAGLPSYLKIPGEGLNGVMVANELLTRVNLMKAYKFPAHDTPVFVGKRCVVVGGGNVAMDAARTARRLGAEVTVVYRRGREEMPARLEEIHHAEEEGVQFAFLTNPVEILGDDEGWVRGLECVEMELGEADDSGRRRPRPVPDSSFVMDIDALVIAAGSRTNPLIAQTTPGLEVNKWNLIVIDEETGATSVPGVFAGGDATSGAATVILAMGAGKRAAYGIAQYLLGE